MVDTRGAQLLSVPQVAQVSAAVSTPPSPVREKGYASQNVGSQWWMDLTDEETPELAWPLSVLVYDRMRRQDTQVSSVLRAVVAPIVRTQTRVDGTGCDPEVTQFVAENYGLPIVGAGDDDFTARLRGRDRFNWREHKRLALLMLPFGHSYFEQVYRYDQTTGRFRIRKYGPRLPRTISAVNVARDGGLVSIEQYGMGVTDGSTSLPVNRLIAYVLEREGGNWLGMSLLRSAYKNWLLKDRGLRTWATSVDRNGVGIPVVTAPEGAPSLDPYQSLASDMRAGDNSGAGVANGTKVELLGVAGQLPDIEKYIAYHDSQIARSALGHFLNLGGQTGGQVGSYNLGSVLADTFHLGLETVDGELLDTANAHGVEDLVDLNFGPDEPAPRLVDDPIGMSLTELDRVRAAAGLSSDADLTKFLQTIPPQEGA